MLTYLNFVLDPEVVRHNNESSVCMWTKPGIRIEDKTLLNTHNAYVRWHLNLGTNLYQHEHCTVKLSWNISLKQSMLI